MEVIHQRENRGRLSSDRDLSIDPKLRALNRYEGSAKQDPILLLDTVTPNCAVKSRKIHAAVRER